MGIKELFGGESFSLIGSVVKVKLGVGVVGRISNIILASIIGLTVLGALLGYLVSGAYLILPIILIAFIAIWSTKKLLAYGEKNPLNALLEGSELSKVMQAQLASKEMAAPPIENSIANPRSEHVALSHKNEGEDE